MVGARFENLAPGQVWFLRVVAVDEQGRRSAPSPTCMMSSVLPRPHPALDGRPASRLRCGSDRLRKASPQSGGLGLRASTTNRPNRAAIKSFR
jgi:hypothetical protein